MRGSREGEGEAFTPSFGLESYWENSAFSTTAETC
jgi:hypothetical protein